MKNNEKFMYTFIESMEGDYNQRIAIISNEDKCNHESVYNDKHNKKYLVLTFAMLDTTEPKNSYCIPKI